MLEGIATILETCLSAAKIILDRRGKLENERQQLALLTAQHCFLGVAETGERLLALAGPRPLVKLQGMTVAQLKDFHAEVQRCISIQLARLKTLHALLEDQQVVELFSPGLRQRIQDAVGGKSEGLYSIGAGLLFYLVFNTNPKGDSTDIRELERSANVICCMYPEVEAGLISVQDAVEGLSRLRSAAIQYGEVVRQIIPGAELLSLSKRAAELAGLEALGVYFFVPRGGSKQRLPVRTGIRPMSASEA
jgi:hypothetical protein